MTSRHRFIDTIILFLCSLIFGALFWFGQYWPNNGLDYGTGKMIAGFIAVCIGFGIPALIMLIPGWKLRYTEKMDNIRRITADKEVVFRYAAYIAFIIIGLTALYYLGNLLFDNYFNDMYFLLFVFVVILIFIVLELKRNRVKSTAVWFVLITLAAGTFQILATPQSLGVSYDDQIHYQRTMEILSVFNGIEFDADIKLVEDVSADRQLPLAKESRESYDSEIEALYDAETYSGIENHVSVIYIGYLPFAAGITAGRALGLPHAAVFRMGKWFNLLFYVLIIGYAIRLMKSRKIFISVLSMTPGLLFLTVNYSLDSWLTAWTILGYAIYFSALESEETTKQSLFLSILCIFIGCLVKQVYFPLMLPMVYTAYHFENKKDRRSIRTAAIAFVLVLAATYVMPVLMGSASISDARGGSDINAVEQISYILTHIPIAMQTFGSFMMWYMNPDVSAQVFLQSYAYLGTGTLSYIVFAALIYLLFCDCEIQEKYPMNRSIAIIAGSLGTVLLVIAALYISFTAVGADSINGVQARYLAPVLFPLAGIVVSTGNVHLRSKSRLMRRMIVMMAIIIMINVHGLLIAVY